MLDGGPDPPGEGQFLKGKGSVHCKVLGCSAVSCAKTAEPIDISFEMWTWTGA